MLGYVKIEKKNYLQSSKITEESVNIGLAKIGVKELKYKAMPAVFLVTYTDKRNTYKACSFTLYFNCV